MLYQPEGSMMDYLAEVRAIGAHLEGRGLETSSGALVMAAAIGSLIRISSETEETKEQQLAIIEQTIRDSAAIGCGGTVQ